MEVEKSGHVLHIVLLTSLNVPVAHGVHAKKSPSNPALHEQVLAPVSELCELLGQVKHGAVPRVALYVPGWHAAQAKSVMLTMLPPVTISAE